MKGRKAASLVLSLLVVMSLLLSGLPGGAVSVAQVGIVIDGVKEAAWGDPLAVDPAGDMTEPNLDLTGLYVVEDADNYYIGFDATASTWDMTYGIYIDTDQVDGSGATTDPWGRAVNAVSPHLPEHTLYVWHPGSDALDSAHLNHWTGSWSWDTLISQGGEQAYGAANDWIEYRVPKAALGSPASIALELFTTGGSGHAQDTVPSDPNVAYTAPDWGGDTTTLSAFVTFPVPSWYVAGDFNGWSSTADAMYDDGTHGDAAAGDGVYTAQIAIAGAGRYEFKVTNDTWTTSYPTTGNSWFDCTAGETVTFTFDTSVHSDGWLPMTNIIGLSTEPGTWTAVGDWQGWNPSDAATAMTGLGGGVYQLATTIAAPGTYQYKAVRTTAWDAIGADGRGVNASTASFDTVEAGQGVTFTVDALAGRVLVQTEPVLPQPQPDNNIWWDGLEHDSRDDLYRAPFGGVPRGTPITLRLRAYADDVTEVKVRVWNTALNGQTIYPMAKVATIPGTPYDYDVWELELTAPDYLTVLYYRFIVTDGTDTDYYEDDDLYDGGLGQAFDSSPDNSFQIDVYDPALDTPDWFQDAVVYQILPDRFRNGIDANDPISGTFFYNETPGVLTAAQWNWIVPDPRVVGSEWEGSYSKLFYGGDLQGIIDSLDYLQQLGVNTLYLNPIFESPSNHKYDTTNYELIDDNLGDPATFQAFMAALNARGMRLVLDGVFNHTSSDSQYFDRYGRYGTVGACEDVNSPYRSWYYFYPANPPGSGVCAGDTTYNAWWGFDSLPKLNTTDAPGVRSYIYSDPAAVATHWLIQGADGWRLDVAGDVDPTFWQAWRPYIEAADPNAVIIAEEWGDASRFVLGDQLDSSMNYRFRNAVLGLLRDTDWTDTNSSIRALSVSEFDRVMHGVEEDYPAEVWYTLMNLVGSHDTNRVLIPLDQDGDPTDDNYADGKARQRVMALIQMTMPGAPTIYYGDEVGLVGYGDDAGGGVYYSDPYNRQPYPWPDEPGYDALPAWRQRDLALHTYYRQLIGVRNAHPVLRSGSFDTLLTDDANQVYVYGRQDVAAGETAVVIVNRDSAAHDVAVDVAGYIGNGVNMADAIGLGTYVVVNGQISVPAIPAMSGVVLISSSGDVLAPAAPTNLVATEGNVLVSLTWDAVADAASYNVYRSYVHGGGYELLSSGVMGTTFDDTTVENGTWYYYVVTAVDAAGNESDESNEASAMPHASIGWAGNLEPASISILIGQTTPPIYAQVWVDGVTNAPGAGAGILAQVGYGSADVSPDLWRTWVPMTYYGDVGNNDQYVGVLTPEKKGLLRYLARFSTTGGREWTYAYTWDGRIPLLSVRQSADRNPPQTPLNLVLADWGPTFVTLSWDPVLDDPTMYAYDVFRSDVSGVVGPRVGRVLAPTTEFTDTDVTTGQTYYYVVQAVDSSFNRSGYSNEVAATPQPKLVNVTFTVTVPDWTPDDATVYIVGDVGEFCGWCNPQTVALDQVNDITWTRAFSLPDGLNIQYKYSRGNWDINEWWGPIVSVNNRHVTVDYGTTGAQLVADTVPYWRDPLVIEHDPLDGAVDVDASSTISVTISRYLDPATITADNLILTSGTTTPALDISFVHRTDMTATNIYLTPLSPLDPETTYTMNLLTGLTGLASDNEGVHLQVPYAWSFTTQASAPEPAELFFSEYVEGSGYNKALEIYNFTGATVDLAADGYSILMSFNGGGSTFTIDLTGSVADGDVYVVAPTNATDPTILTEADQLQGTSWFNGDDAVVLRKDGVAIDVIGQVSFDPGSQWGVDPVSTADNTLRRKASVCAGDPDGANVFDPAIEWDGYDNNTFDGLGAHTANCGAPQEPKINEFSANTVGAVDVEYVEVYGSPDTDYSAYTVLEIEGDFGTSAGTVDEVISVGTTDSAGLWLMGLANGALENGTISLLVVKDFAGAAGQDLDTDNDGVLDVTPWTALVDGVSVNDGGAGDLTYGVPVLTVSYDGLPFAPGGASRYPDGTDTDTAADWVRNDFDLAGIPGYAGTIVEGEAYNTPGMPNEIYVPATEACSDPFTPVYAVQGNGAASPLVGTEVSVEAVVVGDFQNNAEPDDGDLNGFHIQDPTGDGDPATSDGVFIYAAGAADVQVGDHVRVHGTVSEYNGMTEITAAELWDCGTGTVPAATPLTLPVTDWTQFEPYEGMLVTFPQTLYTVEYFNFDRYGEIMVAFNRQFQPTALYEPGSARAASMALKNSLSRITIDDGRTSQNPNPAIHPNGATFDLTNLFRGGDTVQNVTGVLDYSFNLYRIQPTEGALYTPANVRTTAPDPVGGTLKVASFNVLNYFTTIDTGAWICGPAGNMECRGADTPEELARQRAKIVAALAAINADIVGLIEIENHATNVPTADLVAGLNDVLGAGTYAYIATGFIGTDAIEQAIIYKPASVTPLGAYAILDSTVDPTFIDTLNRPVLAQSFTDNTTGGVFTVAVNHLKSKGSECPGDPDTGDGSGNCNLTRTAAAQALVNWLATDPTGSGDSDALIIGDLNSYAKESPIDAILAGGYTNLIRHFLGEYAYSYLFDAGLGYLDHALASASLFSQVTGATVWHINADEADLIDYDMTFKQDAQDALYAPDAYRASDHDPVIIGLSLTDDSVAAVE